MTSVQEIALDLVQRSRGERRFLVAVAGPPGVGKSTFSQRLAGAFPNGSAAVLQMDGFHYDNKILQSSSLLNRKGAPETFDFGGFKSILERIRSGSEPVTAPIFDRTLDLARAGAVTMLETTKFVIVEGNYLLLAEEPWSMVGDLFDYKIFLNVERTELERRLVSRWTDLGMGASAARFRVAENDMPNVDRVLAGSTKADLILGS